MKLEPLPSPPIGPSAAYLFRLSKLNPADGRLYPPFAKDKSLILPHSGSVIDYSGLGIFGIVPGGNYRPLKIIRDLGPDVVARHFRWQVFAALKSEVEADPEDPSVSRRVRRAWILFTGSEYQAKLILELQVLRQAFYR